MELQTKRLRIIPCTEESLSLISTSEEYEIGSHIQMYLDALKEDLPFTFRLGCMVCNGERK
ncbi:hypothetical protein ACTNEO_00335 [Gracilibacillus sp. HCP3S3_G5_1]|uniref:hypothetical protein n=1 Tax=unclassified Gracilibacillus TaxID=2625209 RepID=UPI003F8C26FC